MSKMDEEEDVDRTTYNPKQISRFLLKPSELSIPCGAGELGSYITERHENEFNRNVMKKELMFTCRSGA